MDVSEIVALYNETTILRAAFGGKFDFRSWQ